MVEDVHQIIQNLKSLVVSLDDDVDEAVLSIRANRPGPITAKRIRAPGSVTIHDRATTSSPSKTIAEINIELRVNKGRGFVLADQQKVPDDAPVDLVRIDAIYNPSSAPTSRSRRRGSSSAPTSIA